MKSVMNQTYQTLQERQKVLEREIFGDKESNLTKSAQYHSTYLRFLRGDQTAKNSLAEGIDGSGGFLVPDEFEKQLIAGLESENVLRKISNVIQTRFDLKIPGVLSHGSASWVDEEGAITDTDDAFNQIVLKAYKMATRMRVSDELLEDSGFDIESHIAKEFARRIGKLEEESFLTGDGIGKPMGLLNTAPVSLITTESGSVSIDDVIDLMHGIGTLYRENSVWLMNESTVNALLKVKSAMGQNIWLHSIKNEIPTKLLGSPVVVCDSMPAIEQGSRPILFGDFSYFWIGDRGKRSIKRLSELYATEGQVGFMASQRVDAKLIQPAAIKCLQVKA